MTPNELAERMVKAAADLGGAWRFDVVKAQSHSAGSMADRKQVRMDHGQVRSLHQYCPLTAIGKSESGEEFGLHEFHEAGFELDLTPNTVRTIVAAADQDEFMDETAREYRAAMKGVIEIATDK